MLLEQLLVWQLTTLNKMVFWNTPLSSLSESEFKKSLLISYIFDEVLLYSTKLVENHTTRFAVLQNG